jgi:preflagellin peptidase FlaK
MSSEYLDLVRFILGVTSLIYASVHDLRTRSVPDRIWITLCLFSGALLFVQMVEDASPPGYYLIFFPIVIILLDTFDIYDLIKERIGIDLFYPLVPVGIVLAAVSLYLGGVTAYGLILLSIPGMMVLAYILYSFRVLHGGGDAKGFIALSFLHPFYPAISVFPLIRASETGVESFGFSIIVIFYAAITVVLTLPIYYLLKNRPGERTLPHALFGYRMRIEEARKRFVWPMEVIRNGRVVTRLYPGDEDPQAEFDALQTAGRNIIWVTPKIPFMLPMTAGYLLALLLGNPLILLFRYLLGV